MKIIFKNLKTIFQNSKEINDWLDNWQSRLSCEEINKENIFSFINNTNPAYIPRNHRIEEMINKALEGDFSFFNRLNDIIDAPFSDQKQHEEYKKPPKENEIVAQTFCGT